MFQPSQLSLREKGKSPSPIVHARGSLIAVHNLVPLQDCCRNFSFACGMEQRNEAASNHASLLTCSFLFRALATGWTHWDGDGKKKSCSRCSRCHSASGPAGGFGDANFGDANFGEAFSGGFGAPSDGFGAPSDGFSAETSQSGSPGKKTKKKGKAEAAGILCSRKDLQSVLWMVLHCLVWLLGDAWAFAKCLSAYEKKVPVSHRLGRNLMNNVPPWQASQFEEDCFDNRCRFQNNPPKKLARMGPWTEPTSTNTTEFAPTCHMVLFVLITSYNMYLFRASLCRFFATVCYCNCEAAV